MIILKPLCISQSAPPKNSANTTDTVITVTVSFEAWSGDNHVTFFISAATFLKYFNIFVTFTLFVDVTCASHKKNNTYWPLNVLCDLLIKWLCNCENHILYMRVILFDLPYMFSINSYTRITFKPLKLNVLRHHKKWDPITVEFAPSCSSCHQVRESCQITGLN